MGERIMYQRISTRNQNLARQETMAVENKADKIFVDVMSCKDAKPPQLQEMLAYARAGDILIIESVVEPIGTELKRFTRNYRNAHRKRRGDSQPERANRQHDCKRAASNCAVRCAEPVRA